MCCAVEARGVIVLSVAVISVVAELVVVAAVEVADISRLSGRVALFRAACTSVLSIVDAPVKLAGTCVEPHETLGELLPGVVLLLVPLELSLLGQSLARLLFLPVSVVVVSQLLLVEACARLLCLGVLPSIVI